MKLQRLYSLAGSIGLTLVLSVGVAVVEAPAQLPYADSEWRSVHQGPANADKDGQASGSSSFRCRP